MAAQAPELPAGREPMPERWCYFCGNQGKSTKGSARGRKKVNFYRCRRTQPGHGQGAAAHDGSPASYYFPGGRLLRPRTADPERLALAESTPHWACVVCAVENRNLCIEADDNQATTPAVVQRSSRDMRRKHRAVARTAAEDWLGLLLRASFDCDDEEVPEKCALWLRLYLKELSIKDGLKLRFVCVGLRQAMDASEVFKTRLEFQMQMKNFSYRTRELDMLRIEADARHGDRNDQQRKRRARENAKDKAADKRELGRLRKELEESNSSRHDLRYTLEFQQREHKQELRHARSTYAPPSSEEEQEEEEEEEEGEGSDDPLFDRYTAVTAHTSLNS